MERLKLFVFTVGMWIVAFFVTFDPDDVEKRYQEEGIPVTATISHITRLPKGKRNYQCTYNNIDGQQVSAYLILNQFNGEVGQVVEGFYLPEEPGKVYCPPSKILKYGIIIFVDAIAILLTVVLFADLFGRKTIEGDN